MLFQGWFAKIEPHSVNQNVGMACQFECIIEAN